MAGHVVAAKLDVAFGIAGEGIDCLIGLAGFQLEVVLQLDLPPVAGLICGNQDHGIRGIFPVQGLHGAFGPALIAFKTVAYMLRLFDFLDGVVGEDQIEIAQATQFQAAVGLAVVLKPNCKAVLALNGIVFIGAKIHSIIVDKLDPAGCVAGEGIGNFVALACCAVDILLHLDLPPVGGIILRDNGHGGCGILPCDRLHRAILPNLEAAEPGCGAFTVAVALRRCGFVNFLHGNLRKLQFAGTQAAQLQTAVAVTAGLQFHGEGILTLLHVILIGAVVSRVVIDELDTAGCIAGKAEGHLVILASLALLFLLQFHLPPVGGRIGVDEGQALGRLGTDSGSQCALSPDIHTGEGILCQQFFQLLLVNFLEVNVSKDNGCLFTAGQHAQLKAGTLLNGFVGSQIESCDAQIAVHPLGSGADDRCRAIVYRVGNILILAAFSQEDEGGLISFALDQVPVHSQLDPPALFGLERGRQMAVGVYHHGAAGLFRGNVEEIIGQVFGQFLEGNAGDVQLELIQFAQFQTGRYLAAAIFVRGKANHDLIFAGFHSKGVLFVHHGALAGKPDRTSHIAGKAVDHFIEMAVCSFDLLIQPDLRGLAGSIGGGQGHAVFGVFPLHILQAGSHMNRNAVQAIGLAALAQAVHKLMAVFIFSRRHAFRGCFRFHGIGLLLSAGCQGKDMRNQQKDRGPFFCACICFFHKCVPPNKVRLVGYRASIASTSAFSGMTRRAPLRVVIRDAAALAKVSISSRFSSVRFCRPCSST